MLEYKKLNNILGWVTFGIAFLVYLFSVSPTASFWDCGEFIACANELEIGHPPGAPLWILLGRIFAIFGFGDGQSISFMVNLMSVFSSAFTVMFTFWITTILAKKMLVTEGESITSGKTWIIMFAGLTAAFVNCFADSFWFNAVEAEVYAMSSFFTAIVVWLMFKWEARADEPGSLRYIILIAYLMGLSIGVHLLNLLAIPALAVIYFNRKYDFSWKGLVIALGIGTVILGIIQKGIIQYTFDFAWFFEKMFVGTQSLQGEDLGGMGMPYGSGVIFFLLLLFGGLGYAIWWTQKQNKVLWNVVALSALMVYVGYASYIVIPIRSAAGTPINENTPDDVRSMISLLKREQYGDWPVLRGTYYSARPTGTEVIGKNFVRVEGEDRYVVDGEKEDYKYSSADIHYFPRMHSPNHYTSSPFGYKEFVTDKGLNPNDPYDDNPSGRDNMKFFWQYQVVHMYFRYFMWNFAGREGDVQDMGYESGFFTNTSEMPEEIKSDRARNHYFYLPLLLGLLGAVWHFFNRPKDAGIVGLLFFFTGLAIILYLNQTPTQPRERDYSYAGSFQTFAIWVGIGVIALYQMLKDSMKTSSMRDKLHFLIGPACLIVPLIMVLENWNDHSRAGRYVAPDSAYNLLNSCEENAILFTNGDNDTFPLWYLQEVEGIRTDVRVVNLSLLNTDWYIDQMKMKSNDSEPLPISMIPYDPNQPGKSYRGERNSFIRWDGPSVVKLAVDKQKLLENGVVTEDQLPQVSSPMNWELGLRGGANPYVLKQDLLIMDMISNIAQNGWDRPIYFASTIPPSSYLNLMDYFYLEGMAYRLKPIKKTRNSPNDPYPGSVDADKTYEKLTQIYMYRGLNDPSVFLDWHIRRTIIGNMRSSFYRAANAFIEDYETKNAFNTQMTSQIEILRENGNTSQADSLQTLVDENAKTMGDSKKKAEEILLFEEKSISDEVVMIEPYYLFLTGNAWMRLGNEEKANEYFSKAENRAYGTLMYYKQEGEVFEREDMYLAALQFMMQHYVQKRNYTRASEMATKLFDVTGSPQFQQQAQQLLQMGNQPAPQPETAPQVDSPATEEPVTP